MFSLRSGANKRNIRVGSIVWLVLVREPNGDGRLFGPRLQYSYWTTAGFYPAATVMQRAMNKRRGKNLNTHQKASQ